MSTDDYLDAIADYNAQSAELDKLQKFVDQIASALNFRREKIVFLKTDDRARPADIVTSIGASKPFTIDVASWPTIDQLQTAVRRWNEAKSKAQEAWKLVPEHRRPSLPAPPR